MVFYTGAVGIVFNRELFDAGKPSQRFFFGEHACASSMAVVLYVKGGGLPYLTTY